MSRLREVQGEVAEHMEQIQRLFKEGAKITVLVRQPDKPEQDFLLTDDDLAEVGAMLERCSKRGARK